MSQITRLLNDVEQGDAAAAAELLPLVYGELRKLAAARLASEKPGQTLEPTALVHEAYLRMVGDDLQAQQFQSRGHFFAAAAEAMRRILVDAARKKHRQKRGGDRIRQPLDPDQAIVPADPHDLVELDEVLEKFAREHPRKAELVKLRFFAGLTQAQSAEVLGIGMTTADRDWAYARAWLFRELGRRG